MTYTAPDGSAERRRVLGHRRLGRYRRGRRHRRRGSDRRSRRARRLRRRGQFSNQGGVMTVFGLKNPDHEVSWTPGRPEGIPSGRHGGRLRNEHGAGARSAPAPWSFGARLDEGRCQCPRTRCLICAPSRSLLWPALGARRLAVPGRRPSAPRRAKPGLIRVCADPDNMPSSNDKGEGYENKIAELIAKELKSKLELRLVPHPAGLLPHPQRHVLRHGASRRRPGSTWPASPSPTSAPATSS